MKKVAGWSAFVLLSLSLVSLGMAGSTLMLSRDFCPMTYECEDALGAAWIGLFIAFVSGVSGGFCAFYATVK